MKTYLATMYRDNTDGCKYVKFFDFGKITYGPNEPVVSEQKLAILNNGPIEVTGDLLGECFLIQNVLRVRLNNLVACYKAHNIPLPEANLAGASAKAIEEEFGTFLLNIAVSVNEDAPISDIVWGVACPPPESENRGTLPAANTTDARPANIADASEDGVEQRDIRTYIVTVYREAYPSSELDTYMTKRLLKFTHFKEAPTEPNEVKEGTEREIYDQVAEDVVTHLRDCLRSIVSFPEPLRDLNKIRENIAAQKYALDVWNIPVTVDINYLKEHKDDPDFQYFNAIVENKATPEEEVPDPDDDCPYTNDQYIDFTVKCRMARRHANCFASMLKTLEFTSRHDVGPQIVGIVTPEEGHAYMTFDIEGFEPMSCIPSYPLAGPRTHREEIGDLIFDYEWNDGDGPSKQLKGHYDYLAKEVVTNETGSEEFNTAVRDLKTVQMFMDMGFDNDNWIRDGLKPKLLFYK